MTHAECALSFDQNWSVQNPSVCLLVKVQFYLMCFHTLLLKSWVEQKTQVRIFLE